ncbi:transposase [Cohnella terricola]|uniref:IS1595 family transposase n=1 Tax=Cohnella terricola TaxID=1289167 RepID=A0A559JXC4_9BACL|nr:transposase [Cohnella terricola]TVY04487.1 IS1595 family transposase [Cohnella terricola]
MKLFGSDEKFNSFCAQFSREEDCFGILFNLKWPEGFRCPHCRHTHFYLISTRRLPLYECRSCRSQTSLIVGTIMEGSRTPLHLWFQAIYLHTQPFGVNAVQLAEAIGVTYKTAWLIGHKIRHAMVQAESNRLLTGIVRISDTVYSRRYTGSVEWHRQEQPLLIGASSNENEQLKPIIVKLQSKTPLKNNYDFPDPLPFIRYHVDPQSAPQAIITRRYGKNRNNALASMGHKVTWWIASVYRGIGPKHLQRYLDQFCYVYNRSSSTLFEQLISDCAISKRITYSTLTQSSARSIRPTRVARTAVPVVS